MMIDDEIELLDDITDDEKLELIEDLGRMVFNGHEQLRSIIKDHRILNRFVRIDFLPTKTGLDSEFVLKCRFSGQKMGTGNINIFGDVVQFSFERWAESESKYYKNLNRFCYGQHVRCSMDSCEKVLLSEIQYRCKAAEVREAYIARTAVRVTQEKYFL